MKILKDKTYQELVDRAAKAEIQLKIVTNEIDFVSRNAEDTEKLLSADVLELRTQLSDIKNQFIEAKTKNTIRRFIVGGNGSRKTKLAEHLIKESKMDICYIHFSAGNGAEGLEKGQSHYMAEKSVSEVMELINENRYKLIVIDDPAVLGTNLDWFFFNSRNFNFIITSQNFKYIEKYLEHNIDCIYYTETVPTPKVNEGNIPLINFDKDVENIKHQKPKIKFNFRMY